MFIFSIPRNKILLTAGILSEERIGRTVVHWEKGLIFYLKDYQRSCYLCNTKIGESCLLVEVCWETHRVIFTLKTQLLGG